MLCCYVLRNKGIHFWHDGSLHGGMNSKSNGMRAGQSTAALREWIEARQALSALRDAGTPPPLRQQFRAASRAVGRSLQHPAESLSEVWLLLLAMGVTGVWVRVLMAAVGVWPLY